MRWSRAWWTISLLISLGVFPWAYGVSVPLVEMGVRRVGNGDLERALGMLQQGRIEEASRMVEQHLAAEPESTPGLELRGVIQVLSGREEEGLQTLLRVVGKDPGQATAWTKIGDIHRRRGDSTEAKGCFQRALALDPQDRHANQRLGLLLEEEGEIAGALEHLERGILGTPSDYVGVKVNLGSLYNRTGQFRRTVELLRPVLGESLVHPVGHLTLGAAQLALGNSLEALQSFERAKRGAAEPAQTAMALGIAYRQVGRWDESLAEFRLILQDRPADSAARFQLAETLAAMKRIPEAIATWEEATSHAEVRVLARIRQAEVLSEAGQAEAALACLDRLKREGHESPRSELLRARILERADRLKDAGAVLAQAASAYPGNSEVRLRRGLHLGSLGKYEEAALELGNAASLAPAEPRVWKALALAWYRQRDWTKAESAARKLLELVPKSTADRFFLGSILDAAGKDSAAQEAYEQVVAANPKDVAALNNLAVVLARRKELPRAMEVAASAVELAPKEAVVWDTLGWIHAAANRWDAARDSLNRAVALPATKPTHRYHLAFVLEKVGASREAMEQLNLALGSDTTFPERQEAEALRDRLRLGQ